jgi:hypothetical protein
LPLFAGVQARKRLRSIYERGLSVCHASDHEALWEAYEAMEREAGDHKRANALRWRRERGPAAPDKA